ncbi:MAG: SAM-dependent DNA methyltransferase, partial [Clostridia bacterium]|nr:SAM-dependent DNA methyltransferase [Clostridia bacterium]
EYLNSIISAIVTSQKNTLENVYNPFLNDASSLIDLTSRYESGITHVYGRGNDMKSFCAGIVKFLISYFDLDNVFLNYGSSWGSVEVAGTEFDTIVSCIPPITQRRFRRISSIQNDEILKRNNKKRVKSIMAENLGIDMDALENDSELDSAIENIAIKMAGRKTVSNYFVGEYEVLKNSEYRFLIDLMDNLKDDGMMVVSLSQGFLAKNSLETLRKYLTVERNCIDCIISLPDELSRPRRPDVIVIFRKCKRTDDILFIDLSMEYDLARNRYGVRGTFKSNLILGRKTLDKVVSVYNKRQTVNKFSNVVSLKEIMRNDFVLSTSRYVDTFEGDFIRLEDLKNQKDEITSNIKELNKKIEMMMDELGIDF